MTAAADIAVLIVAYRSRETLPRVLDCLQAQTLAPARVLVLENGSPPGEAVDEALVAGRAELIISEDNLGFAAGNNRLAEKVDQSWIFLLNPDAFPEPDLIEQLVGATQRHAGVNLFGCTQLADGAKGVLDGAGDVYHITGLPYRGGYGRRLSPPPEGEVFAPCGAAMLIKRALFERIGGFDEDYFSYVEDVDFGFRARLIGETCIQLNAAVVSHMGYASSGRRSEFATYHGARNRLWTFFKNVPGWGLWLLAPLHVGVTGLLWLSAARFGQFTLFGEALRDAIAGWPHLMRKRRDLMARRSTSTLALLRAMSWNPFALLTRAPDVRPIKPNLKPGD
jgi:N-acetylglucosaminyl-diphospho-decaprenol L-rhamnosyltransferase